MRSRNVVDLRSRPGRLLRPSTQRLPLPDKKQRVPLRARRRRVRTLLALAALLLLVGCAWTVSYVSYLPRFNISSVTVVGASTVSPDLIEAYAQAQLHNGTHPYLSRENIFLYDPERLSRDIVGYFPRIRSARVERASLLATDVQVTVVERQPFAQWCADQNDCYEMDDSGFIFAQAASASSTRQYVFKGGIATSSSPIGRSFAPGHMPGILALLQMLSQAGFTARGASVENEQDFSISVAQGFYIKASFGQDADMLVKNLQLILSSDMLQLKADQLEYIDLRFGDRVYYKLKGGSETKAPQ